MIRTDNKSAASQPVVKMLHACYYSQTLPVRLRKPGFTVAQGPGVKGDRSFSRRMNLTQHTPYSYRASITRQNDRQARIEVRQQGGTRQQPFTLSEGRDLVRAPCPASTLLQEGIQWP